MSLDAGLQALLVGSGASLGLEGQVGIQQIANGEITNGLNSFVGALLLPLVGPGLSILKLINDIVPNLMAPVQNVLNLLDVAPTVLLNVGIAPIQVLSNFTNALGNGIEGLRDAVLSGNPENVVNAVINATAGFASATKNSLLDPNSGVIGIMLNVRKIIADALPPAGTGRDGGVDPGPRCQDPDRVRNGEGAGVIRSRACRHDGRGGIRSRVVGCLVGEARHDRGGGQGSRRRHPGRGRRDEHRRDDEDVDRHEVGLRRCVEQHRGHDVEG